MTFNAKVEGFMDFFGDFRLRDTLQERIVPKPIKIDMVKLHMKFSALNVDSEGPSFDFLGSRKPEHEGIKERYPRNSRDEMAGDRLTVCEQELLYAFARPVSISSNLFFSVDPNTTVLGYKKKEAKATYLLESFTFKPND